MRRITAVILFLLGILLILLLAEWAGLIPANAPSVETWLLRGLVITLLIAILAAELALALIVGGLATWQSRKWGVQVLLVGLGMAIYSEIASPGYFAQQGIWMLVGMFAVLLAGALVSVWKLNHNKENGP